jgi:hypothetical protein
VKTPMLKTETERVVFIPEAPRSRRSVPILVAVIAVVLAMLLSGVLVFFWQQGAVRDAETLAQVASAAQVTARADANAALTANSRLQVQISDLEGQLKAAQDEADIFKGQNTSAASEIAHLEDKLSSVKAELAAVTGPKLSHGDHVGFILSAGSAEIPPMIVIQVGRWFTGPKAQKAALADGAIVAGEHVRHDRYFRTTTGSFRVVEVAVGATFTVRHYAGVAAPTAVSLSTLAQILASPDAHNERTSHNPFLVTIGQGHVVTGGNEQSYQAP